MPNIQIQCIGVMPHEDDEDLFTIKLDWQADPTTAISLPETQGTVILEAVRNPESFGLVEGAEFELVRVN